MGVARRERQNGEPNVHVTEGKGIPPRARRLNLARGFFSQALTRSINYALIFLRPIVGHYGDLLSFSLSMHGFARVYIAP